MAIFSQQGRVLKEWLKELNEFDHANTLPADQQRLATRIYVVLLTIAVIIILVYSSIAVQQYSGAVDFPTSKDFEVLQSLEYAKLSCPCSTILIPYETFITLVPVFHPICSSEFVKSAWSDALFYENASMYLPLDIRSTLSAQYQLLSSLCSLAQQTINDDLQIFNATHFINTKAIDYTSLQLQVDALVTAFQSSSSSSLLRALSVIRNMTFGNLFISGVSSSAAASLYTYLSDYYVAISSCGYETTIGVGCNCYDSYTCLTSIPVGISDMTMPINLPENNCYFNISINDGFTAINGLAVGCLPLESLLTSTLACLYDSICLETIHPYLVIDTNTSVLILSEHGQFTPNSKIIDIIGQLFVHQWKMNFSYDAFFNTCAPIKCTYTYTKRGNFIYIISTLLGLYGGLTVALQFVVLNVIKYRHMCNNRSLQAVQEQSTTNQLYILFGKIKKTTIELNLFVEKNDLSIHQQRMATRVFFVLFSSAVFILILFSMLTKQTYIEHINLPTQTDFERLQNLYPNTLSCPCSQIIIPQNQFINLFPRFHVVCSSIFISQEWFTALLQSLVSENLAYYLDFRYAAVTQFHQLKSICELTNQTIQDGLGIFNDTPFISSQILPISTLNIESSELVTTFQSLTRDMFSLQLKFLQKTSYGNQLISSSYSNVDLEAIDSNTDNLTIEIASADYQISNISSCSCILEPSSCAIASNIYDTNDSYTGVPEILVPMPTFLFGCFLTDSLYLSTLECFYNQSCLDTIQPFMSGFNMTALPISSTSQYKLNAPIGDIIQQLLVEEWNISISYEQYFSACASELCTYSYERRANLVYLLTILFSLFGGLTVVFRMISPFLVVVFFKRYRHHEGTSHTGYRVRLNNLFISLRSLPPKMFKSTVTLNLFKRHGQQNNEQRIRSQQQTTRLYLCILISTLTILIVHQSISSSTFSKSIDNPSETTFEQLYQQYADILICPCSHISMNYSQLIEITFTFHPICSSDFITQTWFNAVFDSYNNTFAYFDFRTTALASFQILSSLCELANDTLLNARSSFLTKKFISTKVISSDNFGSQIEAAISIFQLNTRSNFIELLQLIRDTTSGNALMTVYTSAWRYVVHETSDTSTIFTRPVTYNHENGTCSCGRDGDCSEPAAIYTDTETIKIPGMRVGCYPLNIILQSTLQCLHEQECVDLLRNIFNISESFSAIDNTSVSLFSPTATIFSIVHELFIEKWQKNISYEHFFSTCAAKTCSFSYSERANFIYVLTTLIGLYGGLNISLKLLAPILIRIFQQLVEWMKRFRANRIIPMTD